MTRYAVQRFLWLPILLLSITFITFALGFYGPGDPIQQRLGQRNNPEAAERLRAELGLDRPFVVQYLDYVVSAAQGDFGESISMFPGKPVSDLLISGLWVSFQLNAAALIISITVGIPLGIIAALNRNGFLDYLTMTSAVAGISFPSFALGPILMWIFMARLQILSPGWEGLFSSKAILPVFILSLGPIAVFARQTRANLSEVLDEDYVRTARSKGLAEQVVIIRHALRNAIIPLLTILGLMIGSIVGSGAFITEQLFGIPGIGRLGVQAFFSRDYPVIMALTLVIAVSYAFANLLVDLFYALADPRIRIE